LGVITNSAAGTAVLTVAGSSTLGTTVGLRGNIQVVMEGTGRQGLNGTNAHTGTTTVNAGNLRINSDSSGATNTWNVVGGTLGGFGVIGGPVVVGASGTLDPGEVGAIGTLTISNNLSLAGNVVVQLNPGVAVSNDFVNITGALNYGGILSVTNIGATNPPVGATYRVFPTGGSGSFASIVASPGLNVEFADGLLTVVSGTPPTLNYTLLGGGVLQFSWTGSAKLQWQTNALSVGVSTNWVDYPDTSNPVNVTNSPSIPAAFFRLQKL
jgi:autotransporter-associated beta strand protein